MGFLFVLSYVNLKMYRVIQLLIFSTSLLIAKPKSIAVLDFEGKDISDSEASILTDRLRSELFNLGNYKVLERALMEDILREQGLQQAGICNSSECAVEIGNLLGVQQLVGGSVGKIGNMYTVTARIIDVGTGSILKSANYDHLGNIEELVSDGMQKVVLKLIDEIKLTKDGRSILKNNDIRYLNSQNLFSFIYLDGNFASFFTKQLDSRSNAVIGFAREKREGKNIEDNFEYPSYGDSIRFSRNNVAMAFSYNILKKKLTLVDPIIGVSIFLQFISINNLTDQKFAKTTVLNGGINIANRFQILKNMGITFGFFLEYSPWLDFDENDNLYSVKSVYEISPMLTLDFAVPKFGK